jgi:putative PIN family toxin of toxin-antitoxin system
MLIVLDTDVVVAGLRSPTGASAELLRRARAGSLAIGASVALFMEYEAVCTRPEHLRAAGLKAKDVKVFLDALAAIARPVHVHFLWRPQLHDAADELVLEAAVNAQAQALLTFNTRHFAAAASRFGLRLAVPGDFLRSLA